MNKIVEAIAYLERVGADKHADAVRAFSAVFTALERELLLAYQTGYHSRDDEIRELMDELHELKIDYAMMKKGMEVSLEFKESE